MFMQMVKIRYQRSRSQRWKQILPQFGCFQTVTPVWIHRQLWNDAQSLKWHRRGTLLFSKVIHQNIRTHEAKNEEFCSSFSVSSPIWIHGWLWNDTHRFQEHGGGVLLLLEAINQISKSHGPKPNDFDLMWARLLRQSQMLNLSDLPCLI